ncbi:MAG: CRISPR-associated protein Csx19 [Neomegalonema sp.]|nr:CRISPR-associated protein Csx19 [Neomegalonema sp.]
MSALEKDPTPAKLYRSTISSDLSLPDVLKQLPDGTEPVAFVHGLREARFAVVKRAELFDEQGNALAIDQIYEAVIFTCDWELRWQRNGDSGQAAVIAEKEQTWAGKAETEENVRVIKQCYVLWGQVNVDQTQVGWLALSAARIGKLWVPEHVVEQTDAKDSKGEKRQLCRIRAVEYAQRQDSGNYAVIAQRFVGAAGGGKPKSFIQ